MRLYIYILLLLFFSCDELGEESGPLDYNGLITEGWNNFMLGDYVKSQEFFLDVLDIDPSLISYYSEAYLGLGFSTLFEAILQELTLSLFQIDLICGVKQKTGFLR